MELRSRRLERALDPAAARFLSSVDEDSDLIREDLVGTSAHVMALVDAKVLTEDEAAQLRSALHEAYEELQSGRFKLEAGLEDVHMNVEAWLTEKLGDLGKKVHTARSRNDQVALDLRLAARRQVLATAHKLMDLVGALNQLGDKAPKALLPGYTHLQPAQPIAFGHWTGLHTERILRDLERLRDAYARVNVNPLGAAALAGTSFPIDPAATAKRLGFDATFRNSLDAVSDRDFLTEIAFVHAQTAVHLSQLAEDVILWTNPSFGFLRLSDAWSTGSSIMPQKKNADVFEVARAHGGTATGELVAALIIAKGLPAGYNRDLQEQKRILVTAWRQHRKLLDALPGAVLSLEPDLASMEASAAKGHVDATEVADHLVRQGVPFREAHAKAAELVKEAMETDSDLSGLDETVLRKVLGSNAKGIRSVLGANAARRAKTSPGGTADAPMAEQRKQQAKAFSGLQEFFADQTSRVAAVELQLLRPVPKPAKAVKAA